jgi:hypothetical protein
VPVDQQADEPIPVTVPAALGRHEKLVDLGLGQMLSYPIIHVRFVPFDA